eukprot:TRINITY_DN63945_c0_g1_i1.p1 TRINITY_DN63945_c0_g1~~TRINITY_DN63945_c0_g1_i1.p1  ORF type:complete len:519 (+),score=106.46 TRINITY_DN63945_c0_g1_i1:40-1596(+)
MGRAQYCMRQLQHSASAPGLGIASRLAEGTLFLARGGGAAEWQSLRFAHNSDGSVSFRPASAGGDLPSAEVFLDADWRQPFLVAPCKPVSSAGRELFPFTLSYAPLQGREPPQLLQLQPSKSQPSQQRLPQQSEAAGVQRRTLLLAAPDAASRSKWLKSFARKLGNAGLRPSSASGERGGSAEAPLKSKRRFVQLGESHSGLSQSGVRQLPRLPNARAELWEAKPLHILRELYDGYAADPLTASLASAKRSPRLSKGDADTHRPHHFLAQYLEKQASIECMLGQTQWRLAEGAGRAVQSTSVRAEPAAAAVAAEQPPQEAVSESDVLQPSSCFRVLGRTRNTLVEGDILRNEEWSGGVLFAPPSAAEDNAFQLCVSPLDPLKTHPIFIGIAPPDANLTEANFFASGGGIFLCLGGQASETLISALGAPGGPAVHGFGERIAVPELPMAAQGGVQLHYTEAMDRHGQMRGHICFGVFDYEGKLHQCKPKFRHKIPAGVGWVPCLLLCVPETRVRVKHVS